MNISTEELIKAIKNSNEYKKKVRARGEYKPSSRVKKFINDKGIESGTKRIPNYVIYYTYRKKWRDSITKCKKVSFFRHFCKHFTQVRTGKQRYYLLNEDSFDLSREGLLKAEHYDKKTQGKKSKPKKRIKPEVKN